MCAVATSATNSKVIYLGANNPIEDIIAAAEIYKPEIITLSISHEFDPTTAENLLFKIRSELDSKTSMVTGGKGSPSNIPGISYIPSFDKYYDFLSNFNQPVKAKV